MAVTTTNTEKTAATWQLAASGAGEFHITLSQDGEYAYAASAPSEALFGHMLPRGEKLTVNLPAAVNAYVRVRVGQAGAYTLVVTPGQ